METTEQSSRAQVIIKYGVIFGLLSVASQLVFYIMGYGIQRNWATYLVTFIVFAGSLFLGIKALREDVLGGHMSYGQGVGAGVLMSIIAGIISSIYFLVLTSFIDTGLIQKMIDQIAEEMMKKNVNEEAIEQNLYYTRKFMTPVWMFVFGTVFYIFWGLIATLILSIFLQKEDPDKLYQNLDK